MDKSLVPRRVNEISSRRKITGNMSSIERTAEKAYSCALQYKRYKMKSRALEDIFPKASSLGKRFEHLLTSEAKPLERISATIQFLDDSELVPEPEEYKFGQAEVGELASSNHDLCVMRNSFVLNKDIQDVIIFILKTNRFLRQIHDLRLETPICTLPDMMVKVKHLDDYCGLGKTETNYNWMISLLPNRQLRLENKDACVRLHVVKEPTFVDEDVIAECCLVPGGHLICLTFTLNAKKEDKDKWLIITDNCWKWNSLVLNYMILHPFGSTDAVSSILRIAFVDDPEEIDESIDVTELFNCYYSKRHFFYVAVNRQFFGNVLIGQWGFLSEKRALFFRASGDETNYLMAIASNMAWFREWQSTIYSDFIEDDYLIIGKKNNESLIKRHMIRGFLEVTRIQNVGKNECGGLSVGRFVYDTDSHQLSSIDWRNQQACIESLRIIKKPETDGADYDFRFAGYNLQTNEETKLQIRVVTQECLSDWISVLGISTRRGYVFMEMLLRELEDKRNILTQNYATKGNPPFRAFQDLIDKLPRVEMLGRILSCFNSLHLDSLACTTMDALYEPLISLAAAQKISEKKVDNLVELCGEEKARFMELVHRHLRQQFSIEADTRHRPSQIEIWRTLVPLFTRINELEIENRNYLVEKVAQFFYNASYSYYKVYSKKR